MNFLTPRKLRGGKLEQNHPFLIGYTSSFMVGFSIVMLVFGGVYHVIGETKLHHRY